ncbi:MAG: glycosyltransferase family 2 protein [Bacteroidetes bacterium]|nr:MAG: glycosyltransferase family 2 protein [Bacteroidota bacterium]
MRIGNNPEKEYNKLEIESYHRVIIPVYLPNLTEDYFKDGLKILKLCFESLLHTIHSKTKISIINNGCCNEASEYLRRLFDSNKKIDQYLHSKVNLGKINALYSAIKSNLEPIITISDADVLFLPEWQQEVEKILNDFPESGMVSPVPSSKGFASSYLNCTKYYALFKGKLNFSDVIDPEGMKKFQKSIGREMYKDIHLEKYLTISNKKGKAVMGCGHFVATFRAEVFNHAPKEICNMKIVGGSENKYIDIPNDKGGFLRLSTLNNYAYHLGNVEEEWMAEEFNKVINSNQSYSLLNNLPPVKPISKFGYLLGKLIHKLLFSRFRKYYFKFKGMKQPY